NVAKAIFVSEAAGDVGHDTGNLAIESQEPDATAGHFSEALELILSLEIGEPAVRDGPNKQLLGDAYAIDGYIGLLQFDNGLVQGKPTEGVDAGGQDQDSLLALDVLESVGHVREGIEKI